MKLAQRMIFIMVGLTVIIAMLLAFFNNGLNSTDFILLAAMFFIPIFLLVYFFSKAKKKTSQKRNVEAKSFPLQASTNDNSNKLDNLVKMTENRLYKLSSVFPFDFFPDHIFIEQKQVVIIHNQFFASAQDYHILIKDILMPVIESSIFFSALRVEVGPGGFYQNPPVVPFLKKSEALKAKRIIMGLIICDREKIDLSAESPETIVDKVEEIGRTKID